MIALALSHLLDDFLQHGLRIAEQLAGGSLTTSSVRISG